LQKDGVEEFGAHDVILVAKNSAYSNWREKFVNAFCNRRESASSDTEAKKIDSPRRGGNPCPARPLWC
jgi:hypothetical protein